MTMLQRGSGVLCHITSLPSPYGIGDLGPGAYAFTDFLAASRQKIWQILPLNPTDLASDNSPYHSCSAFAFNPLLISPDLLIEDGLLTWSDVESIPDFAKERVEFDRVIPFKKKILSVAYERFKERSDTQEFESFCAEHSFWLDDYALFVTLKSGFQGLPWNKWPPEIKRRHTAALKSAQTRYHDEVQRELFHQYIFWKQWRRLKRYCYGKGIQIIGDMPIYVVHDSSDLWTRPELFQLDGNGRPSVLAGVPPDYFSQTGQLWGNPLYRWDRMKKTRFDWWIGRVAHNLSLYDWVRIDHFRGFVGYWEIPAKEKTAVKGRWVKAPALDFFTTLKKRFRTLPLIAEDLGIITPDVKEIMILFGFPGMKVLLFAFGDDNPDHPYLPHTYEKNCIAYTGTHDNNTVKGWFQMEAKPEERKRLFQYIGRTATDDDVHWELIKLGAVSEANNFIVPVQDIVGLGEEARMNRPATKQGNWRWRLRPDMLTSNLAEKLAGITDASGRV